MITAQDFEKAIVFAVDKHKGQVRKGDKRPYILHPIEVMMTIYQYKKSKNIFLLGAGAILHDTVEDCDVTLDEIAREFGYHVAALVQELTLDKNQYEKIGKKQYLAEHMVNMSNYALTIKLADRYRNINDFEGVDEMFKCKYLEDTIYIMEYVAARRKFTKTQKKLAGLIFKITKSTTKKLSNSIQ